MRAGKDPVVEAEKTEQAAIAAAGATFKAIAEEWMADELPGWSAAHASRFRFLLEKDLYPTIGRLPIADIDILDVHKAYSVVALLRIACSAYARIGYHSAIIGD